MFQTDVYDPDDADCIADPLPPAVAIVGVADVAEAIEKARRVTHYASESDELGPRPVSREQIRSFVRSVRNAQDSVIVTARFEGPDLVVRTFEYLAPKVLAAFGAPSLVPDPRVLLFGCVRPARVPPTGGLRPAESAVSVSSLLMVRTGDRRAEFRWGNC